MNVDSSSLNRCPPDEMMTIAAARLIQPACVCFVGIGVPSAAANLARLTHAPDLVLIYESGAIGTHPNVLPLSIGDGKPTTRLPGAGGAPEIALHAKKIFVVLKQSQRSFVAKLDFCTSAGFLNGHGERTRQAMPG